MKSNEHQGEGLKGTAVNPEQQLANTMSKAQYDTLISTRQINRPPRLLSPKVARSFSRPMDQVVTFRNDAGDNSIQEI